MEEKDLQKTVAIDGMEVDVRPLLDRVSIADELDNVSAMLDGMAMAMGRVTERDPFTDVEGQAYYAALSSLARRVNRVSKAVMQWRAPEEAATLTNRTAGGEGIR